MVMEHDFLSQFPAKTAEYLLALSYLVCFTLFWRYMSAKPSEATVARPVQTDFQIPDGIWVHPGHAWARLDGALATVGIDDFGHKLVGKVSGIEVPPVGTQLSQGDHAWSLSIGGKRVQMLSPVNGTVVEVNEKASADPTALHDPYGLGWIARVKTTRPSADTKQLLYGAAARNHVRDAFESLLARASPELGAVAHDGGVPVHGLAQAISPEHWDAIAREHFLTGEAS
jgi:glycine cleavage system H protein